MSGTSIYVDEMSHSTPIPAAKVAGGFLHSSLITGRDPKTGQMPADFDVQMRNMFAHIEAIMAQAGGAPADIIKVTLWLNDRGDRNRVTDSWVAMFPDAASRPARVTLNRDLGGGKLIECEIVALIGR